MKNAKKLGEKGAQTKNARRNEKSTHANNVLCVDGRTLKLRRYALVNGSLSLVVTTPLSKFDNTLKSMCFSTKKISKAPSAAIRFLPFLEWATRKNAFDKWKIVVRFILFSRFLCFVVICLPKSRYQVLWSVIINFRLCGRLTGRCSWCFISQRLNSHYPSTKFLFIH